jgi:hypothetical protein
MLARSRSAASEYARGVFSAGEQRMFAPRLSGVQCLATAAMFSVSRLDDHPVIASLFNIVLITACI